MKDPAALNIVARARDFAAALDDVFAALDRFREALKADEVKHRPRRHHHVCRHCGTPYTAHRQSARYCSDVCRQAARKERIA